MPVRDAEGRVIAAMSVSIPTPRYGEEMAARTHVALAGAVEELSVRLGYLGAAPKRATGIQAEADGS